MNQFIQTVGYVLSKRMNWNLFTGISSGISSGIYLNVLKLQLALQTVHFVFEWADTTTVT